MRDYNHLDAAIKVWETVLVEVAVNELATGELVTYLKALIALQLQVRTGSQDGEKPEVLLARVGLPARDIAEILGKSQHAVVKAIQRAGRK